MTPQWILLVDDNIELLRCYRRIWVSAGHHVRIAGDGLEAMALLERALFDLIVSDVHMPNMDGVALFHHVRALEMKPPFVLMSAEPTDRVFHVNDENISQLVKPVSADWLLSIVATTSSDRA